MAGTGKLAKHVGQLTWAFGKQVSELISYHRDYAHNPSEPAPVHVQLTSQPTMQPKEGWRQGRRREAERGGYAEGERPHAYIW